MRSNISQLIRRDLQQFKPYSSSRDEAAIDSGTIWLNANESPYIYTENESFLNSKDFLSPIEINRYPQKQNTSLLKKIAALYQVPDAQIVIGRGGDELIDLLSRLFCNANQDAVITCPPTFGMYAVAAKLQGARVISVPLLENSCQLDVKKILDQVNNDTNKVKIIYICSPNNPTGNLINQQDIRTLCDELTNRCIIVVDEAYLDFANKNDSMSLFLSQYTNLVVLKTFSKAYGLAGARCGVLLANEEIVEWIKKIIAPYPLSVLTIDLLNRLLNAQYLQQVKNNIEKVKAERERLFAALNTLRRVKNVWTSDANFLLLTVDDVEALMAFATRAGIILRRISDQYFLKNCVRITVGLPSENDAVILVMKQFDITERGM